MASQGYIVLKGGTGASQVGKEKERGEKPFHTEGTGSKRYTWSSKSIAWSGLAMTVARSG